MTGSVTTGRAARICALAASFLLGGAGPAAAHGFRLRYDLPLPLAYYVWGAGATVALSFLVAALFLQRQPPAPSAIEVRLGPVLNVVVWVCRAVGLATLALVIIAGLFGNHDPVRNIAPTMVWIIGWVGVAFVSIVVGNVWAVLNPWNSAFAIAERAYARLGSRATLSMHVSYPPWLGVWPGVLLLVIFAWMELVWAGRAVPQNLAIALLAYSAITWSGMFLFGRRTWLAQAELFQLVFGTFARFAPFAATSAGRAIRMRLPAAGLLDDDPRRSFSVVAFVVALLATVTFDGFLETPPWARLEFAVMDSAADSPFWAALGLHEVGAVQFVRTLALLACIVLFIAAYALVCALTAALSGNSEIDTGTVARLFVLTLVPIALAYHVAHYFSFLFNGGQYVIPLLSDPLGRGWDLFGTARYRVDIGLVTAELQWKVALVAVVLGHVIAVYLAHVTALKLFPDRRSALVSQIPMIALMVGYTMVSLWILSQPIVEGGGR